MLLELPTELIQLVLRHASTSSYVQTALCCHYLYTLASTRRDLILHHLNRNPGAKGHFDQLATRELFLLLRRRVTALLLNASTYADRTLYSCSSKRLNVGASSIGRVGNSSLVASAFEEDQQVHLIHVDPNGTVSLRASFKCPPQVLDGTSGTIVKTTFTDDNALAILVRVDALSEQTDAAHTELVFIERVRQQNPNGHYCLLHFPLDDDSGECPSVCRIYEHANFKAEALAVKNKSQFAVSWQHIFEDEHHEVIFYEAENDPYQTNDPSLSYLRYKQRRVVDEDGYWPKWPADSQSTFDQQSFSHLGPVKGIEFNRHGPLILYSYRSSTLFKYYQYFYDGAPASMSGGLTNRIWLRTFDALGLPFTVSTPFFAVHETVDDLEGCYWKFLSFGTATHPSQHWTVACLVRSEGLCRDINNRHELDLDYGRPIENCTVVARLWGYPRPSNTLGCIFAASPRGTRIAVSNWDIIYVWALDPNAVMEEREGKSDYYPYAWRSKPSRMVELRPVVFHLEAVCFKIMFTENEDIIMALTDKGLMVWDLRSQGQRRRLTSNIDIYHCSRRNHISCKACT